MVGLAGLPNQVYPRPTIPWLCWVGWMDSDKHASERFALHELSLHPTQHNQPHKALIVLSKRDAYDTHFDPPRAFSSKTVGTFWRCGTVSCWRHNFFLRRMKEASIKINAHQTYASVEWYHPSSIRTKAGERTLAKAFAALTTLDPIICARELKVTS